MIPTRTFVYIAFDCCLCRALFVCQSSDDEMKKKNNMISRLEEKTNQITATMKQLEQRWAALTEETRAGAQSSFATR